MKYLFYSKLNETRAKVVLIYSAEPGNKSMYDGYIESVYLQEPEEKLGMSPTLYCNPETKELWYEYEDIPKTPETEQQERIESLEQSIAELTAVMTMFMTP